MPDNIICRMDHAAVSGQQNTDVEDISLKFIENHLTALISEDGFWK